MRDGSTTDEFGVGDTDRVDNEHRDVGDDDGDRRVDVDGGNGGSSCVIHASSAARDGDKHRGRDVPCATARRGRYVDTIR